MNTQLSLLVQLQQFDLKIHELEEQQQQIPVCIKEARLPLDQANVRLGETEEAIEKAEKLSAAS